MVAATKSPELDRPEPGEQRLISRGVTYQDYVLIGDVLGHRPGLHLTYLRGTLEIMTTSPLHEHLIGRATHTALVPCGSCRRSARRR